MIVGDGNSISILNATIQDMEVILFNLENADEFTKNRLQAEYNTIKSLWQSIRNNTKIATELGYEVTIMNFGAAEFGSVAGEAQRSLYDTVQSLPRSRNSAAQAAALNNHALMLRQISDSVELFANDDRAKQDVLNEVVNNFKAFDQSHAQLIEGDKTKKLAPLQNASARATVVEIFELIKIFVVKIDLC